MATAAPATPTTEYRDRLPIAELFESPHNPRRTFGKESQAELAQSIREKGIVNPLHVRPGGKGFEILAGSRRYRAAKSIGETHVPAIVHQDLDDKGALELMVVDNLQREDVHEMEEAEGYEVLHQKHGYTIDELAAKVGKSRGYVYARMKLCALTAAARKPFLEGRISASVALQIARIPVKDLQERATKEVLGRDGGEPMSFRDAAEWIQRNYMLHLGSAPFPVADAELVPAAGACGACPKKTGNQRELFSDVKSPDMCTDPACFKAKSEAHAAKVLREATATGRPVLSKTEAAKVFTPHGGLAYGSGYVRLEDRCYEDPKARNYQALLGKEVEDRVVLGTDPKTGTVHQLVSDRVAKGILREKYDWAKPAERSTSSAPSKKAKQERAAARDEEAKRKATLERVQKAQKAIEAAVVAAVLKAPAGSGSSLGKLVLEEWRMNGPMTPDDKRVPPGKSAEDLVRYLAFSCLQADLEDAHDFDFLAMRVKPLGVDLGKLLDQYAPEQPAAAETEVKAKRASGPLARKKGAAAKAKATKRGK